MLASCSAPSISPVEFHSVRPEVAPEPIPTAEPGTRTLSQSQIEEIKKGLKSGGPPKDGIPAVDKPIWVDEGVVEDDERVFGILDYGEPKAVPASILFWHEIVNDKDFSLTWCPLTGTGIGYKDMNLGVSGKLYNSNLVMYDRATQSEIPQIWGIGIDKTLKGKSLEKFRVYQTTWKKWKAKYPNTKILSRETGHNRNYDRSPYPGYETAYQLLFPVSHEDDRFHRKKIVHGIENNGEFMAIPLEEFKETKQATITLGGDQISITYDEALDTITAKKDNELIPSFDSYWFAWYAFHPNTKVYHGVLHK